MKKRTLVLAFIVLFIAIQVSAVATVQAQPGPGSQTSAWPVSKMDAMLQAVGPTPTPPPGPTPTVTADQKGQTTYGWRNDQGQNVLDFFGMDVDLILIALLWLILIWLLTRLFCMLRISIWTVSSSVGPIQIEDVKDNPKMAVLMRQYLQNCGARLSNPADTSAPNDTPGFDQISAALDETKDPRALLISTFLKTIDKFLKGPWLLKKPGYTVSCSVTGDESKPPINVSVEIKMMHTAQIKRGFPLSGDTNEEVAKKAAYLIFWYISGRKNRVWRIPAWNRFPTYEGFLYYNEAKATKKSDISHANENYQKASNEAPFNALVFLGWADLNELNNHYLKALEIYLEGALIWPHLYAFWYRIAAIFSCPCKWIEGEWQLLGEGKKDYLTGLITRLFNENILMEGSEEYPEAEKNNLKMEVYGAHGKAILTGILAELSNKKIEPAEFYVLASFVWGFLEKQIQTGSMIDLWVDAIIQAIEGIIYPTENTPSLAGYYWGLIPLLPWQKGQQLSRSIQIGKYCTSVQRIKADDLADTTAVVQYMIAEVEAIVAQPWSGMDVYYNAACFYALLIGLPQNTPEQTRSYTQQAIHYLKIAYKDPKTSLQIEWIKNDPDFNALIEHKDPEFAALFDITTEKEFRIKKESEKERKTKLYALGLVQQGARQQQKDWGTASESTNAPEALIIEAEYQINLWNSLNKLLDCPDDPLQQELFWQLVMQKGNLQHIPVENEKPVPDTCLTEINSTWKIITDHGKLHMDIWNKRLEDSKLFLQHHNSPSLEYCIKSWKHSEVWQWEYFSNEIDKCYGSPPVVKESECEDEESWGI